MNTTQLECFMSVSNFLNFSRAAEQLGLTQPAVSHQINALEDELGAKLFYRTSKQVRLTQEGHLFSQYAREILSLAGASRARLQESVETVIAGYQKKNAVIPPHERKIVAYHEVGHALVAACQSHSAPVQKITIIPRTSGALGYTMQVDEGERYLMSREEALNKIATFTGGRAAEEVIFQSITTGASNDIEQATKLARAMVTRYGMTDEFDMVAMETVTNQYLGGDTSLACSPETARMIDEQVVKIVKEQHAKAVSILRENEAKLHEIAAYLLEKETITGEEFMNILEGRGEGASSKGI